MSMRFRIVVETRLMAEDFIVVNGKEQRVPGTNPQVWASHEKEIRIVDNMNAVPETIFDGLNKKIDRDMLGTPWQDTTPEALR